MKKDVPQQTTISRKHTETQFLNSEVTKVRKLETNLIIFENIVFVLTLCI